MNEKELKTKTDSISTRNPETCLSGSSTVDTDSGGGKDLIDPILKSFQKIRIP